VEFLEHLKVDLFPDEVYVFTPKGKILSLPRGATAVDFAYAVHTDIGNRCVAVKINQELMPLRTALRNGDRIEIITATHARPNPAWLNYVVTAKARAHIRHFLKTLHFEESSQLGERLLNQALVAFKSSVGEITDAQWEKLVRDTGVKSRAEILADVGLGKRLAIVVARQLLMLGEASQDDAPTPGSVMIRGSEGMAVQLAQCCRPIPGDRIVGVIRKGQGMVVHVSDCPVIAKMLADRDRTLDVEWDAEPDKLFSVAIKVFVAHQRGVLAKVAAEIAEAGSNIENVTMESADSSAYTTMYFTLQVSNRVHLAHIMRTLRQIPEVTRITRVKGT
jgi:GTP pyrophosphokinase